MEDLKNVEKLAGKVRYAFVATADVHGLPHVASAGRVGSTPEGRMVLADWFCPATVENVAHNPRVAVVVWDPEEDFGYQVLGEVEALNELGMLDGYVPEREKGPPIPQTERELIVRVKEILSFTQAPHTDVAR